MCTITILRTREMLRLVCNRDESRTRPLAHPPFITSAGDFQVLTPQDPEGRGTWIAANSVGLVFALLNVRSERPLPEPRSSRGLVIPSFANCASLEECSWQIEAIAPDRFAPFRLLVADDRDCMELTMVHGTFAVEMHLVDRPLLFTSSSLGDALVDGPRRLLFEQMLNTPWDVAAQQDAYHAHRWRDRPAVSVHMSRPDACTVSTTAIEVTGREVRMVYSAAHCDAGTAVGLAIDRQQVGDAAAVRARREYAAV